MRAKYSRQQLAGVLLRRELAEAEASLFRLGLEAGRVEGLIAQTRRRIAWLRAAVGPENPGAAAKRRALVVVLPPGA
jgi:hypothetical protein